MTLGQARVRSRPLPRQSRHLCSGTARAAWDTSFALTSVVTDEMGWEDFGQFRYRQGHTFIVLPPPEPFAPSPSQYHDRADCYIGRTRSRQRECGQQPVQKSKGAWTRNQNYTHAPRVPWTICGRSGKSLEAVEPRACTCEIRSQDSLAPIDSSRSKRTRHPLGPSQRRMV